MLVLLLHGLIRFLCFRPAGHAVDNSSGGGALHSPAYVLPSPDLTLPGPDLTIPSPGREANRVYLKEAGAYNYTSQGYVFNGKEEDFSGSEYNYTIDGNEYSFGGGYTDHVKHEFYPIQEYDFEGFVLNSKLPGVEGKEHFYIQEADINIDHSFLGESQDEICGDAYVAGEYGCYSNSSMFAPVLAGLEGGEGETLGDYMKRLVEQLSKQSEQTGFDSEEDNYQLDPSNLPPYFYLSNRNVYNSRPTSADSSTSTAPGSMSFSLSELARLAGAPTRRPTPFPARPTPTGRIPYPPYRPEYTGPPSVKPLSYTPRTYIHSSTIRPASNRSLEHIQPSPPPPRDIKLPPFTPRYPDASSPRPTVVLPNLPKLLPPDISTWPLRPPIDPRDMIPKKPNPYLRNPFITTQSTTVPTTTATTRVINPNRGRHYGSITRNLYGSRIYTDNPVNPLLPVTASTSERPNIGRGHYFRIKNRPLGTNKDEVASACEHNIYPSLPIVISIILALKYC